MERTARADKATGVLVAYDGSAPAQRALLHAADLVGRGGVVTVINVIPAQGVSSRLQTVSEKEQEGQRLVLREARSLLRDRDVRVETIAEAGDPVSVILAAAEGRARTVVVGRGSRQIRRLPHGSLSSKLVRAASCDVLVVH